MNINFFVPGVPVQQGSKKHVGNGIMVEDSKNLQPWRDSIIYAAREQVSKFTAPPIFTEVVAVRFVFYYPRPKSHYGTGKNATRLKSGAPQFKPSAPDIDKLVRAACDALTAAGVWRDDALVASLLAFKKYEYGSGSGMGVSVTHAENSWWS